MRKCCIFLVLILLVPISLKSQIVIPIPIGIVPEHGFLPGKKFKFYETIEPFDFKGLTVRMELYDSRAIGKNSRIKCSDLELTNTSEFANPASIHKVADYFDVLLKQSGATIDSTSSDTMKVWLEGLDARLIGHGYVRAHGLCQIRIKYRNIDKIYCTDITDADKNSPISPNAIVTRLTATRIMASASIREVVEQFFVDLNYIRMDTFNIEKIRDTQR